MVKRKVAALEKVDADLAGLQYKIRRDPRSYKDEFLRQWEQYESQREIFLLSPSTASPDSVEAFRIVIDFIAHVAQCYPEETQQFGQDLKTMLSQHHATLHRDLREKMVGSLMLLRRKDVIDSSMLLTTLFPILVSSPSKSLRTLLFQKIVSDLRNANAKSTNHPLNRTVQTVLHNLITTDRTSPQALWAVKLTRELWKRLLWTDARPVEVMKEACLSENEKVTVGAVRFFLGGDKEREELEDDSSDDEAIDVQRLKHQMGINKKTKKSARTLDKAVQKVKKAEKKKSKPHPLNFSALHLLHDPQGFAENLFSKHLLNTKTNLCLESKLAVLQLVTRLVGLHKLTMLSLYSWFSKSLTPRQQSVTTYLACLAQSTHNLVAPDSIEPLLVKIANEFVSEASAAEVAAAGLNAIREICVRQPLAMSDTLLQDLVQYRKSKDKGVMMAAKGLLSLYRNVGAELLRRRDRGKKATIGLKTGEAGLRKFGDEAIGEIDGIELLERWKEEEEQRKGELDGGVDGEGGRSDLEEADEDEGGWEVASNDSSDSGGWMDVSHDEDEGEDETTASPAKRARHSSSNLADSASLSPLPTPIRATSEGYRISKLATTSILTPADLAKLQELRMEAGVRGEMGARQKKAIEERRHVDDGLTAEQIEIATRLRKTTKEERVALAHGGKPEREEHKSTQAIRRARKQAEGKSSTNREKARNQHFFMTLGKAKAKQKRSLVETRKVLTGHVQRAKRGGRRANGR